MKMYDYMKIKNIINNLALIVIVLCCTGAGPCWKHNNSMVAPLVYTAQPNYTVSYVVPYVEYKPVIVQSFEWVPVMHNVAVYGVVTRDYRFNNTFYYASPYVSQHPYNPWITYNY